MTRIDWALAGTGVALGVAAMAVDHLLGDDPGLEDPVTFIVSAALVVVVAAVLFGRVVRRAHEPRRTGVVVAALAVATLPLVWLGLPFGIAPAAVALGLRGRGRSAALAVGVGLVVLLLAAAAYAYQAVDKLS